MIIEWGLLISLSVLCVLAWIIMVYPLRQSRLGRAVSAFFFFCMAFAAYWHWGAWSDWCHHVQKKSQEAQVKLMLQAMRDPQELVDKLKAHLAKQPHRAQGWYVLGRLYASQGKWLLAEKAFAEAHRMNPKSERFAVNEAQSLWQLNHQQFNERIRQLLQGVLNRNPKQADALAMLAMDAFLAHAYSRAIEYWERLLAILPPQSGDASAVRKAIAKARKHLRDISE